MTTFTSEDREMAAKHEGIESPHNACCYKDKCRQQQAEIEALKAKIAAIEKNTDYWADKANWIKPNKPVAELVLEQMAVGDARSLRVKWLMDGYPPVGTKLYAHQEKELNDGGEPVKNATYWKRQCNLLQSSLTNLQSSLYHANEQIKYLESHQVNSRKTSPA